MKLLQYKEAKSYDMHRIICQLIEVEEIRDQVQLRSQAHQERLKEIFDKRSKERIFMIRDIILKWDARREAKGKNGEFYNLYLRPFQVIAVQDKNTYELTELDGEVFGTPVNKKFLKHFLQYRMMQIFSPCT
jgi:hypothetical protein